MFYISTTTLVSLTGTVITDVDWGQVSTTWSPGREQLLILPVAWILTRVMKGVEDGVNDTQILRLFASGGRNNLPSHIILVFDRGKNSPSGCRECEEMLKRCFLQLEMVDKR